MAGTKRGQIFSASNHRTHQTPSARQIKKSKNMRHNVQGHHRPAGTPEAQESIPDWSPNDELEGWELDDTDLVDTGSNVPIYTTRQRYAGSDNPMQEWMLFRAEFLNELLRHESQTEEAQAGICPGCLKHGKGGGDAREGRGEGGDDARKAQDEGAPLYRCRECYGGHNVCQQCCLKHHRSLPLHIIEKWNGRCFQRVSLRDLGLRIQLGHSGGSCPVPEPATRQFTVLHTNGIHMVNVDYCSCDKRVAKQTQLLRERWYPATVKLPATCATFELLRHFHGLSLCSKVSAYEYYLNLERLTNNSRVEIPKTRYRAFLRMIRQFRHLRMMKRAGRGNVKDGIATTEQGGLALLCPACPIPGINLPDGWMDVPPALRFLYTLFVSIDANFRLKNRLRNSEQSDPGLHTGLAYFVACYAYNQHILKHASESDISSCSSFNAMSRADSKSTNGLRYTGVGMCVCARHEMVRPMGVGDLQKGERYCNMDYILLSALYGIVLINLMVIYDIACQWKVNFAARMAAFPTDMQLPSSSSLDFAIPKCHAPAHKTSCQTPHSLNLKPGVGRTDGEGIERDWSAVNPAASSTREMGLGSRHDTLDDLFAHHNWQKTTGLGQGLRHKYILSVVESRRHKALHEDFCETVPLDTQARWIKMITEWERDHSKPNPYETVATHETEGDIKRKLLAQECKDTGVGMEEREKTPSAYLSMGLVLEESQRRVALDAKAPNLTAAQMTRLQDKRTLLNRQIRLFRSTQRSHMPNIDSLLERANGPSTTLAEDANLWLPSCMDATTRAANCSQDLCSKEAQLRVAQCNDALERIRLTQRAKRHVVAYKKKHVPGQRTGTKANGEFERLDLKIKQSTIKYRHARKALISLLGVDAIPESLRELHDKDICAPPAFEMDKAKPKNIREAASALGEGYREVPWIWRVPGVFSASNDVSLNAGLRIEWAKSRARSLRWGEEVLLIKEEMRRVRVTLQYRVDWWNGLAGAPPVAMAFPDARLQQGIVAYAHRQALVNEHLRASFTRIWEAPPSKRAPAPNVTMPNTERGTTDDDEAQMIELLGEVGVVDEEEDEEDAEVEDTICELQEEYDAYAEYTDDADDADDTDF